MKYIKRALIAVAIIVLLAAAWVVYRINDHPKLDRYKDLMMAASAEETGKPPGLRVTFLGVSTLLFEDGETKILTDGFFTRPGKLRTFLTRIEPNRAVIANSLTRAGIKQLQAVIVLHSHYDHALDSAIVAQQTCAELVGSESTARIARSYLPPDHSLNCQPGGPPDPKITVVHDSETKSFGRFQVTFLGSSHVPSRVPLKGEVGEPFKTPARASAYKEGGSYSLLIEHDGKTILVQGSAGFPNAPLCGHHADLVFLGIGLLGKQNDEYREAYWRELVDTVKPRRIIPIHWDDFWLPLDQPLVPMPRLIDNFDKSMCFLLRRAGESKPPIDVKILPAWVKIDPWAGLP